MIDLTKARAHWINRNTLLWNVPVGSNYSYSLHYVAQGGFQLDPAGVKGGEYYPLTHTPEELSSELALKFPHLAKLPVFILPKEGLHKIPEILKGQVVIIATNGQGRIIDASAVQIPGVLDDLYSYHGPLGVTFDKGNPALRVWSPTAQKVHLHLYPDSSGAVSQILPMTLDPIIGVWSIEGKPDWTGMYYLYEVEIYVLSLDRLVKNLVTDPYSISLAMNSTRSQIIDLSDSTWMPAGWNEIQKPRLEAPEDIVLYELHVRDFSCFDDTVPQADRGTYHAFTHLNSNGMKHLKEMAEAGVTHIHLLPVFDFATVNEDKSTWRQPDSALLSRQAPDSTEQQRWVGETRSVDAYNWGYDPYHYNTPEGSYTTDSNGAKRILEFRQMIQAINSIGLRVVMDVVYNHTHASGQNDTSVLDKIVPGYYYRLDSEGNVETSTCCPNTASEHKMMEKLMVDSLVHWATAYKVDGFRFDLMGHHLISNMKYAREILNRLTPDHEGVNGCEIYLYGEGWDFGEMAHNARGINASQLNMGGNGIGLFNDRLRDAVRGGTPFTEIQEQGFATGLYTAPNTSRAGKTEDHRLLLLKYSDWIKASLAGNLEKYQLVVYTGAFMPASKMEYKGSAVAYTKEVRENILYVSAHDNVTLFDAIQLKAPPEAILADRVRMQILAYSLVIFGQGVPFIHAGDEMLRSKSLDRNSFDSGDWFNRIDFNYHTNNFGSGLPLANENRPYWEVMAPLLANPTIKPGYSEIQFCIKTFKDMLRIRKSSPLFRLRNAEDIQQRVFFHNTGPHQIPGVIMMSLSDTTGIDLDPELDWILVVFNAAPQGIGIQEESFRGVSFQLHPIQANSQDEIVRRAVYNVRNSTFFVPGRTTAVFISKNIS